MHVAVAIAMPVPPEARAESKRDRDADADADAEEMDEGRIPVYALGFAEVPWEFSVESLASDSESDVRGGGGGRGSLEGGDVESGS